MDGGQSRTLVIADSAFAAYRWRKEGGRGPRRAGSQEPSSLLRTIKGLPGVEGSGQPLPHSKLVGGWVALREVEVEVEVDVWCP